MADKTFQNIKNCIKTKQSFVLEAGAGSGKTSSLTETLKYLLSEFSADLKRKRQQIVCITYTNVAADEIKDRIEKNTLVSVSTIHIFLWDFIKNFQTALKLIIHEYNESRKSDSRYKYVENLSELIKNKEIEYHQYGRNFAEGKITHDDVINFSYSIFEKHNKATTILTSKYPYIFVDEYQDTAKTTIKFFIETVLANGNKNFMLGFFGDSWQKIYNNNTIGEIPQNYIDNNLIKKITKKVNYRNPKIVIDLLNKIRDLEQFPYEEKNGNVIFINCNSSLNQDELNYNATKKYLEIEHNWDFTDKETKILMLRHKDISDKLHYDNLLQVYQDRYGQFGKDQLFNKEEKYSNYFFNHIERFIELYSTKNFKEFTEKFSWFKISWHKDKIWLKEKFEELKKIRNSDTVKELDKSREKGTIKNVIDFIDSNKLMTKPNNIIEFERKINSADLEENEKKQKDFYDKLMKVSYKEVVNLNNFINDKTPLSTQHGIKGAEFNNVLVVIDDNHRWQLYNKFNDFIAGNISKESTNNRIRNLLYVCFSRAKRNLAILSLSEIDSEALQTIDFWIENDKNKIDINEIRK